MYWDRAARRSDRSVGCYQTKLTDMPRTTQSSSATDDDTQQSSDPLLSIASAHRLATQFIIRGLGCLDVCCSPCQPALSPRCLASALALCSYYSSHVRATGTWSGFEVAGALPQIRFRGTYLLEHPASGCSLGFTACTCIHRTRTVVVPSPSHYLPRNQGSGASLS